MAMKFYTIISLLIISTKSFALRLLVHNRLLDRIFTVKYKRLFHYILLPNSEPLLYFSVQLFYEYF